MSFAQEGGCMRCEHCHRKLMHPVDTPDGPMGAKCAARLHPKLAKAKAVKPAVHVEDERQPDLFDNSLRARAVRFFAAWWDSLFEYEVHL
jgi:hypothetical protein